MFQRDQMQAFFDQVDQLEAKLDQGDFGRLDMGHDEADLVQMAADILEEIAEGLSDQSGFTRAQLIVSSHAIRETLEHSSGVQLTHEQLMERAPTLLKLANDRLAEDEREKECILSGFLDAHGYWRAATYYMDAGVEDQARKCIAGARYWKQRILDSCRD
jgi:hypothetical protein